jgi:ribonuclease D
MTRIVDNTSELEELCKYLKSCRQVGVDIEGDGMYHFREKVCLLQLSDGKNNFIVDPLQAFDLHKLAPFFFDPGVEKIFHGADYDIKSLYRDYGIVVNNLFDTEIASRFAGLKYSGLDNLLMSFLGVKTEKKYQKKDWSVRPLSDDMLDYAAKDSQYLIEISNILKKKLKDLKRFEWVMEESANISEARFARKVDRPYFTSFKGAGKLDSRSLAVLELLLKFRYGLARKKDKPLYKILPNSVIIKVAEKKPEEIRELKKIMSPGHYKRFSSQIFDIVKKAQNIDEKDLPRYPKKVRKKRLDSKTAARIQKLKEWRMDKSVKLGLDPGLVLNNNGLSEIAEKNPKDADQLLDMSVKRWQKNEFGEKIVEVIKNSN